MVMQNEYLSKPAAQLCQEHGFVGMAGLANGALFSRVMANSPGGILPITTQGRPPVFVSAGAQDNVFPVSQGADSVRLLSTKGYVYCKHMQLHGKGVPRATCLHICYTLHAQTAFSSLCKNLTVNVSPPVQRLAKNLGCISALGLPRSLLGARVACLHCPRCG